MNAFLLLSLFRIIFCKRSPGSSIQIRTKFFHDKLERYMVFQEVDKHFKILLTTKYVKYISVDRSFLISIHVSHN